jgi:squalene synthase HpnC
VTATAASSLAAAPTRAAVMAQAPSENFPVASRLVGAKRRRHLLAIYGFARLVDDAGDEASGDRMALLDAIEGDLDRVFANAAPEHPVLQTLAGSVRALDIPDGPFRRLIEANRRDQVLERYPSFDVLLDYCQLSAAPVGELVLHVFDSATPDRIRLSDRICAALQITEHLQDVAEDRARGRVYLPAEDLERFGAADADLLAGAPSRAFAELMAFEVRRARALLAEGAPLIRGLSPRGAVAVAGFVAGGRAALDAIAAAGYDVLGRRPRPTRAAFAAAFVRTLRGRR